MSPLFAKQIKFMQLLPRLIDKAHELGFVATEGDGFRDPRAFGELGARGPYGHPNSAHKQKLAFDINLFRINPDGSITYCSKTEDHRQLGEWWESQGGTWGGRFEDGNHYSLEHNGVR